MLVRPGTERIQITKQLDHVTRRPGTHDAGSRGRRME